VSSDGLIFPRPWTCAGRCSVSSSSKRVSRIGASTGCASSMRASVYIKRLRDAGWPIETELVAGANKFERVRYAVYRLADSVRSAA
jgi:hypothetical protein